MLKYVIGLGVMFSLLIAGCKTAKKLTTDTANLQNERMLKNEWALVYVKGLGDLPKGQSKPASLNLTEKVSGFTGCNVIAGGTYKTVGDKISFGPLATTRKACMGKEGDIEKFFLSAINEVRFYKLDGHRLSFLDAEKKRLADFIAFDWD